MVIVEKIVGEFPYLITDFDLHSYEAEDCFTRFMPRRRSIVRYGLSSRRPAGRSCSPTQAVHRAVDPAVDHVPGRWALMAEQYLCGADQMYDRVESFNRWISVGASTTRTGPMRPRCYPCAISTERVRTRPRTRRQCKLFRTSRGSGLWTFTRRSILRSLLGSNQRSPRRRVLSNASTE